VSSAKPDELIDVVGPNHDFAHIPHIGVTLGALWPVEKNGKA